MKKNLTLLLVVGFFFSCKKESAINQSLDNINKTITYDLKADGGDPNLEASVTLQIISYNHTGGTGDRIVWDTVLAKQKVNDFVPVNIKHSITTDAATILSASYRIDYYKGNDFFWTTDGSKTIFQNSREGQVDISVGSF